MADPSRSPVLGVAIAAGLSLYAIAADRRGRRPAPATHPDPLGRHADEPQQIPPTAWWYILKRLAGDISRDNVSLMAAGVAFYGLLSLAPGFTALVALYGLMFDPSQVQTQVQAMEGMIPEEARRLIADQLTTIVQGSSSTLGVSFIVSLALAIWSANSATSALITALNVAYAEREKRNVLWYYAGTLFLTAAAVLFGIFSIALVAIMPAAVDLLPLGDFGKVVVEWMRWPPLVLLFALALAVVYRYAPSRNEPRWSWVSAGAVLATVLWIAGSALFSLYVEKFATYNKTYGSLGAVVVLLMWLWLSAYAVLIGAELNAEMEHQTARDTTDAPKKPMGRRGAYVADTVAPIG
ncbi:MAG TPA: YihY/virulence factor BrkB family protein [Stellaceae bacterium]|nr:YihY/virulence factor BrkB family protein [Stellaceae bacterium]